MNSPSLEIFRVRADKALTSVSQVEQKFALETSTCNFQPESLYYLMGCSCFHLLLLLHSTLTGSWACLFYLCGTFTLQVACRRKVKVGHVQVSPDQLTIRQDLMTHNSPALPSVIRQEEVEGKIGGFGLSSTLSWTPQLQRALGCSKPWVG